MIPAGFFKSTPARDTKKEILTDIQDEDKKYNSMKRLKGQQFLFSKTFIESER